MRIPRFSGVTFRTDRRGNTTQRGRGCRAGAIAAALILTVASGSAAGIANAAATGKSAREQFLIRLQPVPRLVKAENWTDKENRIVADHFRRLQQLLADGTLILAGRTLNEDETMFGIVIVEAGSEEEARRLMNDDPAVKGGIMTASLFPYRVALIREGSE